MSGGTAWSSYGVVSLQVDAVRDATTKTTRRPKEKGIMVMASIFWWWQHRSVLGWRVRPLPSHGWKQLIGGLRRKFRLVKTAFVRAPEPSPHQMTAFTQMSR